jgi:hypothetical protein
MEKRTSTPPSKRDSGSAFMSQYHSPSWRTVSGFWAGRDAGSGSGVTPLPPEAEGFFFSASSVSAAASSSSSASALGAPLDLTLALALVFVATRPLGFVAGAGSLEAGFCFLSCCFLAVVVVGTALADAVAALCCAVAADAVAAAVAWRDERLFAVGSPSPAASSARLRGGMVPRNGSLCVRELIGSLLCLSRRGCVWVVKDRTRNGREMTFDARLLARVCEMGKVTTRFEIYPAAGEKLP